MRQGFQYFGRDDPMIKADLHIHSTVSDGSDTIEQIIATAEQKELDFIAITDHDTLSHLSQIPKNTKVKVLGGIEISATDPVYGMRAHILGYHIQNQEIVTALTRPLLEARHQNSLKQAEILKRNGYKIDIDALPKADGKYLYKQHIIDHLVTSGQVPEMFGSFYKATFKNGGICAFDITYINVFEAVEIIKKAGGQAVLAHSGQQQNFYLIPALVACGLDGLEYNHHANSKTDQETIRRYAEKYGLYLTGGSDYHGRYEPQIFGIGDYLSEESGVEALCNCYQ